MIYTVYGYITVKAHINVNAVDSYEASVEAQMRAKEDFELDWIEAQFEETRSEPDIDSIMYQMENR